MLHRHATRSLRSCALLLLALSGTSALEVAPAAAAASPSPALFPHRQAPTGAPNVVIVLLDDVGFGAASTFGGPVPTPTLDRLAQRGLRYNTFHTTGICSPTRASLLTGRNSHAVGLGNVMNTPAPYPGRTGMLPPSAATLAEVLRQNGYGTAAIGKWHLAPPWEVSQAGPFDRWPTGMGFEKFYGFMDGETDQFHPTLYEGTAPTRPPLRPGYHLNDDLTAHAIQWLEAQRSLVPQKPFLLYFAPGGTHAPLQAPPEWIARFRGKFDQGWDRVREETLARQKKLGVVPQNTALTPRPAELPAWSSLSPERQRIASRLMEVYAGYLAHTDAAIGRLAAALDAMGQSDNTLFFYIFGDNGASAEGGLAGGWSEHGAIQGVLMPDAEMLRRLDELGGPTASAHYPAGWAWAMDAPLQWTKQVASHLGGIRNAMVVTWPARIRDAGGLRSQYGFVADIMPTVLEAAGIEAPATVNGVPQQQIDGVSLLYSFTDAAAPSRHTTQYYEIYGNRSIYHDGWMASAFHGKAPWALLDSKPRPFEADRWELYDLTRDFSQAHDLAAKEPQKLRELQALFEQEAARNHVLPLLDGEPARGLPNLSAGRSEFVFHRGTVGTPETQAPPFVFRSHRIVAKLHTPEGGAPSHGVIAAEGGKNGGWSLYVDASGHPAYAYSLFGVSRSTLVGHDPLPPGAATVALDLTYEGEGFGRPAAITLSVDGKPVASGRLERTAPYYFTIDETFDIGVDTGSPVGDYPPYNDFTGRIDAVTVSIR